MLEEQSDRNDVNGTIRQKRCQGNNQTETMSGEQSDRNDLGEQTMAVTLSYIVFYAERNEHWRIGRNIPYEIIIMYVYHALINAPSAHIRHINLNIIYTHTRIVTLLLLQEVNTRFKQWTYHVTRSLKCDGTKC